MNDVSNNKAVVLAITFVLVSVAFITVGNARIETDFIDYNNDKIVKSEKPANYPPLGNCSLVIKLPANPVTMIVDKTASNSYFDTTLSNVPSGYDVSNGDYLGWCIDLDHSIANNTYYQVYLYSSYNTSMPSYLWHNNLSKVNYILNNKQGSPRQVQKAIWYILDFGDLGLDSDGWAMINDAIANGSNFCPGVGDVIAIIADAGTGVQYTVIELQVPVYTLTVNTDGNGSVTPSGGTFASNTVVTLTAIAGPGWMFDQWSGNLSGNNKSETIIMTNNKTVTAHFIQTDINYTLTVNTVGNGEVYLDPPSGTYPVNTIVTLTAIADPSWMFDQWSGNLTGNSNTDSILMTSNKTVTAHFTEDAYTLTINIDGNGTVTKDPDQEYYTYGTLVELTATADTGWTFDHWSSDLTGSDNPATINMTSDKTVTANFSQNQYIIAINISGNGSVTKDPDQEYYTYGTLVELTATPDTGWDFSYWSGDINGSRNPITINMISDKEVTAHFTENEYKLTINIDGSGSVIKYPDQNTYPNETVVTLTAVADAGWAFSHWSGNLTGSTNPDNITMDENKTVTAHFKKSSGGSSPTNQNPSADANGPYLGFINEEITFDGSGSTDDDGTITNYTWDFGDSSTGYGVNPTHVYDTSGEYTVILTVTDDDGATDTDGTTALISQPNRPPTTPIVDGIADGTKNTEYTYKSVSTDPDNDTIQYTFDWGDGETNTSEFLANGTATIQAHSWTSAGKYTVTVEAYDNETYSGIASHVVLIDAHIVDDIGYITDDDADGVYDTFHDTDLETDLGRDEDNYLIDNDGDGEWDYVYNPDTEELTIYEVEPTPEKEEEGKEEYAGIIILAIIMIILIIVFSVLIGRKKSKKKKQPSKKTGKKTTKKKTKK